MAYKIVEFTACLTLLINAIIIIIILKIIIFHLVESFVERLPCIRPNPNIK